MYLGFTVVGRENIPEKGAFILASNHVSYLDPPILGTSMYRSLNYMARANLFKRQCFGWIMRHIHAFPVGRNTNDFWAIKESLRLLYSGRPLVIFPEGTRAKDKTLRQGKPGVGFIVAKTRVPVIPAYVGGSFEALSRGVKTLKRHPVSVHIGKPIFFDLDNLDRKDKARYQKISDEIMKRIAELKSNYESR